MKLISTKAHGAMDYLTGSVLILSPWLLGFANSDNAQNIPVIIGISMIVYSIFTSYELGAVNLLGFRSHLTLDFTGGIFLAAAPWLFDFADYIYMPHVLFGGLIMGTSLVTSDEIHLKLPLTSALNS